MIMVTIDPIHCQSLPEMAASLVSKVKEAYVKLIRAEETSLLLKNLRIRKLGTPKLEYFLLNLFLGKGKKTKEKIKGN